MQKKIFYLQNSTVLAALKDLDPERKSYRLVGQVLVERTVRETIPAVEENSTNVTTFHVLTIHSLGTPLRNLQNS
jgi:chaperonin cofactor prefoldin